MPGLLSVIDAVLAPVFDELQPGAATGLRPSPRADFQVDGVLALARSLGRPPRQVAEEVLQKANARGLAAICQSAEVAGPGFINLTLSSDFLARQMRAVAVEAKELGAPLAPEPVTVVVDYGAPNAAKQMHVGHLRSAIIGDAIVRLLEMVGHKVVRENHVGDWGAPFGMLIEHLRDLGEDQAAHELAMGDLETFYQSARAAYDNDDDFAERARERVVLLQSGEPDTLRLWQLLVERSITHFDEAFRRLGTKLTRDDVVGESYYNRILPEVLADLAKAGLLVESDGAQCVFPPGYTNREGAPLPLILRNSVGGYTYAATDLAAIKDRTSRLGAKLLVYVVGLPQAQHLQMVFAAARLVGWLGDGAEAVHVGFGNVLGPDGKMFRTRQGGTVKLEELLDEAVGQARSLILARSAQSGQPVEGDLEVVARAVGVGAVKYSDLSIDRARDYRFDWDRMLSLDGNTAPYIQYAHARICSIFRRAASEGTSRSDLAPLAYGSTPEPGTGGVDSACQADEPVPAGPPNKPEHAGLDLNPAWVRPPVEPEERELAKQVLGFGDSVAASLDTYSPHKLCGYLFELAGDFTAFYEHCPVLRAASPEIRTSRLALCALTGAVLQKGLELLGIAAPDRM